MKPVSPAVALASLAFFSLLLIAAPLNAVTFNITKTDDTKDGREGKTCRR